MKNPIKSIAKCLPKKSSSQSSSVPLHVFWYRIWIKIIIFVVIFVWWICHILITPVPTADRSRREVADQAIKIIVAELRENAGDITRIELLHFENDPTSYVSDTLREELMRQGGLTLEKPRLVDKLFKLFGIVNKGCGLREKAVKIARRGDADAVVWGRVNRLENERNGATIKGFYELYDLRKGGQVAYEGTISSTTVPNKIMSGDSASADAGNYLPYNEDVALMPLSKPWYIRFLWFTVVVLLLPIFTISFIRTMVAKRSNLINAFMLGIYTLIDVIFAFFMIGGKFTGFFSVFLFLLAGSAAFVYNVALMSFALRLESGR